MKILIAADHAGFEMKKELSAFIQTLGHEVKDFGAETLNPEDDYPDFIIPLAKAISENPELRGIILGGSGQGEAIVANRFKAVRADVFYGGDVEMIKLYREHNDANILSLGARFLSIDEAKDAVKNFLQTPFSGDERHVRRIKKLDE